MRLLGTEAAAIPLLQRFTRVSVEDCTVVALPACLAEAYPGCGGDDAEGRDRGGPEGRTCAWTSRTAP